MAWSGWSDNSNKQPTEQWWKTPAKQDPHPIFNVASPVKSINNNDMFVNAPVNVPVNAPSNLSMGGLRQLESKLPTYNSLTLQPKTGLFPDLLSSMEKGVLGIGSTIAKINSNSEQQKSKINDMLPNIFKEQPNKFTPTSQEKANNALNASNYLAQQAQNKTVDTSKSNLLVKAANWGAEQIPAIVAFSLLPSAGAEGIASKIGSTIGNKLGSILPTKVGTYAGNLAGKSITGGLGMGTFTGTQSALEGNKPQQVLNDSMSGAKAGLAFGAGGKLIKDLPRGISNGLDAITPNKQGAIQDAFKQKLGESSNLLNTERTKSLSGPQQSNIPSEKLIQPTITTNKVTEPILGQLGLPSPKERILPNMINGVNDLGTNSSVILQGGLKADGTKLKIKDAQNWGGTPHTTTGNTNTPLKANNALESPLKAQNMASNIKQPSDNLTGSNIFKTSELKTNTLRNSEFLQQPETQKIIDDVTAQYEVKPNAQSIVRATQNLTKDFNGTKSNIESLQALNSAEDTTAAGLITRQLRQEASTSGDYTKLKSWLETIQPKVTETAQSLQALKTWQKLSPESALFKIQQVVGKVNREGIKTYGDKFKKVDFTPDEMKYVNDAMTKIEAMPTTTPKEIRAKDVEFARVKQFAADKVPATLAEKVQTIQRISLLLNPKTMGRNVLGNVIMGGLENIKDIPASLTDRVASLKTGQRTTLMPSIQGLKTQGKGLYTGLKNTLLDAKQGVDTNPSRGQYELPSKTIFKGPLGKLEKATSIGLTMGDRPFYQAAYDESLRQSMKIAKVTEPTQLMLDNAVKMAEDRTYQNTTSLVKGFRNIQKGLNKMTGNEDMGLGTVAIPFIKTPANILDKAIDYSPIGTIKGLTQLMSKKTFDQKLFVDRIGRSITGSATIALGYDLAQKGLITGQANKDKDMAALDKQAGKQAYAIKSGDTYHTIDWMQPSSIPLMIGADIFYGGKDKKAATNVISDAIKSGGTTLFKQSLLQGVQKLFGGTDVTSGLTSVISGVPTQFIPGSLSKQIAQYTDKTVRDTYDPNNLKTIGNQIKSKIPWLSNTLPAKVDTMGREVKQFNGKDNLYNNFLNPGFTSGYNPSPAEKHATEVYNATGDKGVFPRVVNTSITYKDNAINKTIQLTPKEKEQFQKYIGQETEKQFSNMNTNVSMGDQAKALQKVLSQIYTDGENIILKGRGLNAKK